MALFPLFLSLGAQSLWQDHNPYAAGSKLAQGTILKLAIDETMLLIYEYENLADENIDLSLVPDRNITGFLPPVNAKRNVNKRFENRLNSRSRMRFDMAVTVNSDPQNASLSFTGTKFIGQENGISRQQIQVSGRVHPEDVESGRLVHSRNVADLQITVLGAPVPRSTNLPLSDENGEEAETKVESGLGSQQAKRPAAQLSDEQKRQLLWEYINRLLGETTQ